MAMSRRRPRQLDSLSGWMNLVSVPKLLRDRYSVVAHPQNVFVQRRGQTVGHWTPEGRRHP
jgi:hypothetical protein